MPEHLLPEPESRHYSSQRLRLHYLDWGNTSRPLLVLVHGTLDHAHSWDWVASALRSGYHVVAPDLRGHGDSEWARGSEYSMLEYVTDLALLLAHLDTFPAILIGHSLGGGIALQYAGVYPQNVAKLVAIEGLGPALRRADAGQAPAHERVQRWVAQVQELARRKPRRYRSVQEAIGRIQQAHSRLTPEQAYHLTFHGLARNEDGSYSWKFDNYIRASRMAYPYREEDTLALWGRITCPTLLVNGRNSPAIRGDGDQRLGAFRHCQSVTIPGAGHWVHHDQLEEFLRVVQGFLGPP